MAAHLPKKQPSSFTGTGRVRTGLLFGVPLPDGSLSLGFVRATNVILGSMAIVMFDRSLPENVLSRPRMERDSVVAFLLTWPNALQDGSWPLIPRETLPLCSEEWAMLAGFESGHIINPIVHPVSLVRAFVEAARGFRPWDEPLSERFRPADLLLEPSRCPASSNPRPSVAAINGNGDS